MKIIEFIKQIFQKVFKPKRRNDAKKAEEKKRDQEKGDVKKKAPKIISSIPAPSDKIRRRGRVGQTKGAFGQPRWERMNPLRNFNLPKKGHR